MNISDMFVPVVSGKNTGAVKAINVLPAAKALNVRGAAAPADFAFNSKKGLPPPARIESGHSALPIELHRHRYQTKQTSITKCAHFTFARSLARLMVLTESLFGIHFFLPCLLAYRLANQMPELKLLLGPSSSRAGRAWLLLSFCLGQCQWDGETGLKKWKLF